MREEDKNKEDDKKRMNARRMGGGEREGREALKQTFPHC